LALLVAIAFSAKITLRRIQVRQASIRALQQARKRKTREDERERHERKSAPQR